MKNDIFHLKIIPLTDILPHEEYDNARAKPLVAQLKKDGYLTNPIIVASIEENKYLQLDGMNRYSAFKLLGFESILAQIVDYNDQETVELSSWTHLFTGEKKIFLEYLAKIDKFSIKEGNLGNIGHRYIRPEGLGRLCTVISRDKKVYLISTNGKLIDKLDRLNQIVAYYKQKIVRDVLPCTSVYCETGLLFSEHNECNMMVVFPTFTRHQIIELMRACRLFPPGVTRHIIKRRCLNVNLPLSLISKSLSIAEQNHKLEKFLSARPYRVYEEPTIYFE